MSNSMLCDSPLPRQMSRRQFAKTACACAISLGSLGGISTLGGCSSDDENRVVIYSCGEGMRNETLLASLHDDLPEYDIRIHYVSTGNAAARLKAEGTSNECDIILMLEGGYMLELDEIFADLSSYDFTVFCDDLVVSERIFPFTRESGCVAFNAQELERRGIAAPASYDDLLDPAYRGLISFPNPKASGTGYNFLKAMVNMRGEAEAFAYFDSLAENIYQFASSGSGPVNALVQGEALIGFGLMFQAVSEINAGASLEIARFDEGNPWTMNGIAAIQGHESKRSVQDTMRWFYEKGILLDKQKWVPDRVFKEQETPIPNYPNDIEYADMTGVFDASEKERLLDRWNF